MPGKTRVAQAHGPIAAKKSVKAVKSLGAIDIAGKANSSSTAGSRLYEGKPSGGSHSVTKSTSSHARAAEASSGQRSFGTKRKAGAEGVDKFNEEEPEKPVITKSLLNAPEEIDFPRGGGTNLTQVEVREAQLEGENEANDEENRINDTQVIKDKSKAKRRKLERGLQPAEIKEKNLLPKDAFRVEHLNYKRLVPGTKVLGQIILVRPLELIISLPNQLLGHVPITNISAEYTARLEVAGEESSEDDSGSDGSESEEEGSGVGEAGPSSAAVKSSKSHSGGLPAVSSLFKPGQWVSAVVLETKSNDSKVKLGGREGDENVRAAGRVVLSLEPEKVNAGVAQGDLKAGFVLTGSVHSIEDHGYIISLGLPTLTSFLTFKEAKKSQPNRLEVGEILTCRIKDISENGRTCNITMGRSEVIGSTLSSATSITSILPSTLVTALVTNTLSSGLNVKFFGFFDATIDSFHLNGLDPENDFKIGQKLKARVLWDAIGTTPKKFSLSLAQHILGLEPKAKIPGKEVSVQDQFPVGRILEANQVKIVKVDDEWGLNVEIAEEGGRIAAFVHISNITDDHLASIPKSSPWKIGSHHRARVIGYSPLDNLVQLSLQNSVLEQAFLRVGDVKVGEVIKGTVKRLADNALFISISSNVDGVVWPIHYSDTRLKHPEKKFKVGASVKARIYSVDEEKNRVVLTLKKQLITSELPIVARFEEAKVGMDTHATVSKIMEKGVLVDFFGGVRALVPASEAAEGYTENLSTVFQIGKVIAVRVISVDKTNRRIMASARQALSTSEFNTVSNVEIGSIHSGEITALHDLNIILTLFPEKVKALISFATLARHRQTTVEVLQGELKKGDSLDNLVVVSKNVEKGIVIVGLIPSKSKKNGETATENLTFESLEKGKVLNGRICGKIQTGLLIQIARMVRGRVPPTEIADDYDLLESPSTAIGTNVQCVVMSVDSEHRKFDVSLRPSKLGKESLSPRDPAIHNLDDLKVGQNIRGFIKNIANHGVFVSLGGEVTARVQIKELFDDFVKDWKPRFKLGQLVEGTITALNKVENQVEMSLRKNAKAKETLLDFADLEQGQIVKGVVKRIEKFGAFIRIEGSNVSGLLHRSKITDDEKTPWTEFVKEGADVTAIITDIDPVKQKISFGTKLSLFPEDYQASTQGDHGEDNGTENDDEEMEGDEDDTDQDEEEMTDDDGEDDKHDGDDSAEDVHINLDDIELDSDDSDFVASQEQVSPLPGIAAKHVNGKKDSVPLKVSSGFNWDGVDDDDDISINGHENLESSNEDEEGDSVAAEPTKKTSDLSTLDDRTAHLASTAPTSVGDFERILIGSPNSSYLWIQYIAFFLGLTQIDKAREIGRRALKTINFREEQEKLNVWVALLNLENTYGTEESLRELFKEAAQSNDSKTVHLRMIDIYERTGKFEAEDELFKKTAKKFGQSSKVWTLFGQYYLSRGRSDDARDLLPRSLKSLEKRKHVKTISKFAQLEFKLGDAERGRTIFEGIIDNYPKKLDLWFIYIDMEIRQKNVSGTRALFERILTQKLSGKKGKSVFKKWLSFEKDHGDDAGVEACKKKALEFVESLGA